MTDIMTSLLVDIIILLKDIERDTNGLFVSIKAQVFYMFECPLSLKHYFPATG